MDTINKEKDMKPRIIQRRDINKQEWDKFVMESPYGWAFHLYDVIGVDRYKEDKDITLKIWSCIKGGGECRIRKKENFVMLIKSILIVCV